jgi:hypothetical protein
MGTDCPHDGLEQLVPATMRKNRFPGREAAFCVKPKVPQGSGTSEIVLRIREAIA